MVPPRDPFWGFNVDGESGSAEGQGRLLCSGRLELPPHFGSTVPGRASLFTAQISVLSWTDMRLLLLYQRDFAGLLLQSKGREMDSEDPVHVSPLPLPSTHSIPAVRSPCPPPQPPPP